MTNAQMLLLLQKVRKVWILFVNWLIFRMRLLIMGHCGVINGPEVNSFKDTPAKMLVKTLV